MGKKRGPYKRHPLIQCPECGKPGRAYLSPQYYNRNAEGSHETMYRIKVFHGFRSDGSRVVHWLNKRRTEKHIHLADPIPREPKKKSPSKVPNRPRSQDPDFMPPEILKQQGVASHGDGEKELPERHVLNG